MSNLKEVWAGIKWYLANGISIIPVRDKSDETHEAKTPFGTAWKQYQTQAMDEKELWYQMDQLHNTTAIGIVGGVVSGNLEIIDVDVKYFPGIDAILFKDLELLYPELWSIVRVHKTPSGGFHILYRCQKEVEGNQKLAGRNKTEDELISKPKPKTVNFIETRAEGGYVVGPPAMGYSVLYDRPIPVLTIEQRASILSLCRSYTQIIKIEKPYKPTNRDIDYYEENPFDHFNATCNPDAVMQDLGWEATGKSNSQFIWYTRPGKAKGISMSFNLKKRFFYCFTASTELEESHGYTPAVLVSTLLHNNDRKKTYTYLVQKGYGKIKPEREVAIAKRAAVNRSSLPPNASPTAVAMHVAISQQMQTDHPYGVFWYDDIEKGILIDRERLYAVADGLGYKLYNDQLVQILGQLIYNRTQRQFYDDIKGYVHELDAELYIRIANSYEAFIEKHGKFTLTRLQELGHGKVLEDTRTECYKFYENGMLCITANGYTLQQIPTDKLIPATSIQSRSFIQHDTGKYVDFLEKAIGITPYLLSVIGYLAHEYKDDTAGYVIVLTEQCQNPKDGGGSGKNIFSALLSKITTFFSRAGSQVKYDEKFMQAWNYQKIYSIADVLKNFNFEFLKEMTTGSATMKKLHVNEYSVPIELMPKFIISTQFSYEVKDGGLKRRIRPVEFTDFFTKAGGVDVHYNSTHFPQDWDQNDWGGFDTTMAMGVQEWLRNNRKLPIPDLTVTGWHKQFEHNYGRIINSIILENWDTWIDTGFITNDEFKRNCDFYYHENNVQSKYRPSSYAFNEALDQYCSKMGYKFERDHQERQNGLPVRGKLFEVLK